MANEIFYPNNPTCLFNDSYTITACPPVATSCIPMDLTCLWIADPDDSYNCVKCGADIEFTVPYERGDKIMVQTQLPDLVSSTQTNPTAGWSPTTAPSAFRVQLWDNTGAVISSDVTTFSSIYMAAYSEFEGGFNYQILEIDTQAIFNTYGLTCWSLRVNSFEPDGATENRVIYSEGFKEVECNEETVLVKGEWDKFDCCGNYYGEPGRGGDAFVGSTKLFFDNSYRYFATVIRSSSTISKTTFSKRVTKSELNKLFELIINKAVAPFMFNIFSAQHYAAKVVTVNKVDYSTDGTLDNRIGTESGTMILFKAELILECDTDFTCPQ